MREDAVAPPFPAHPALYEVVREEGEPEGAGGVVLIDLAEVATGEDARFQSAWEGVRELLAARQGCLGTRLHRSLGPADFRFVTIIRWSSPLMYARALQQPEIAAALAAVSFPSHRALYLPIQS
jgi:antibiotic biosynthesis monooxygenase